MAIRHLATTAVKWSAVPVLAIVGATVCASHVLSVRSAYNTACPARVAAATPQVQPRSQSEAGAETPSHRASPATSRSVGRTRTVSVTLWGTPVEAYGLVWFLLAFAIELAPSGGAVPGRSRFRAYLYSLAVVGLAGLGCIAYRAPSWYSGWRPITAAACVLPIFSIAAVSEHAGLRSIVRNLARDVWTLGRRAPTWMAITALVVVLAARPTPAASGQPTGAAFEPWYASQPHISIGVPTEGERVQVIRFVDYQCAPCRIAYETYKPVFARLTQEHAGMIRLVTLDFPLERECNPYIAADVHPSACEAAVAVRLARERGHGPEMEAWLFSHQSTLSMQTIDQGLRQIAGIDDMRGRYQDFVTLVRADVETGRRVGVSATPTFFVNGVKLQGISAADLETAITHEMRSQDRRSQGASAR